MGKLLLVSYDSIIRKPLNNLGFIQHPHDNGILKGASQALAHYHAHGWTIVAIVNYSEVAAHRHQLADAIAHAEQTLELFPQILCLYLCPDFDSRHCWLIGRNHDAIAIHLRSWAAEFVSRFRKPQPGMLLAALRNHLTGDLTDSNCWYVGEREEDEEAAMRAGVRYMDADIWRERWMPAHYRISGSPADIETQLLLTWLKEIIPVFFYPIRDRVQEFINNERLGEKQFGYLGQMVFDEILEHLEPEYQPPQIEQGLVDWEAIGQFLVQKLGVKFCQ